jgi:hypothetical protein
MKMKKADLILAGGILLLAGLFALSLWLFVPSGQVAVVAVNGNEIARLDLSEDIRTTVNETHVIVVENGTVRVESAPCPDLVCVKHLPVSRVGETIVCLPYGITVTVEEGRS